LILRRLHSLSVHVHCQISQYYADVGIDNGNVLGLDVRTIQNHELTETTNQYSSKPAVVAFSLVDHVGLRLHVQSHPFQGVRAVVLEQAWSAMMDHVVRDECCCLKRLGNRTGMVDNRSLIPQSNLEYVETCLTEANRDEVDGWKEEKAGCDVT
jgi:hypothetical protein